MRIWKTKVRGAGEPAPLGGGGAGKRVWLVARERASSTAFVGAWFQVAYKGTSCSVYFDAAFNS